MCWILVKPPENEVPYDYIEEAQKKNKDGYGVSWLDNGELKTFKTLNFEELNEQLEKIEDKLMVVHLRATSAGTTCINNVHPFQVPTGVMFHNGTITNLKTTTKNDSDTNTLAQLISQTKFKKVEDIKPLLLAITGTTYNKLVFLNKDGTVDIINPQLGIQDPNGNWYSNDYHVKEETFNVFVYGTLKHGFSNSFYYMADAEYIDDAVTLEKYAMIGKDYPFPYLLGKNSKGKRVKGELYEVTKSTLDKLDKLEGYPTHYNRELVNLLTSEGKVLKALTYVKTNVTEHDLAKEFIDDFQKKSLPKYTDYKTSHLYLGDEDYN